MLSPIYPQLEEQIIFALEMALNIGFFCMCVCLHYEYFRSYSYVCHGSYHLERVVIVSLNAHCWKNIVGFSYICEHVNDEVKKPFKDQYSMNKRERERDRLQDYLSVSRQKILRIVSTCIRWQPPKAGEERRELCQARRGYWYERLISPCPIICSLRNETPFCEEFHSPDEDYDLKYVCEPRELVTGSLK